MTRHSEHQGRVTYVPDPRGTGNTVGASASCGSCGWTSGRVHEEARSTMHDLLEHIRESPMKETA